MSWNPGQKERKKKFKEDLHWPCISENLSYHEPREARSSMHENVYTLQTGRFGWPRPCQMPEQCELSGALLSTHQLARGTDVHTKLRPDTQTPSCAPTGCRTDPDVGTECEMTTALFTERLFYFSASSCSAPCNMTFDKYLCKRHLSKYKTSPAHAPLSHNFSHTQETVLEKKTTTKKNENMLMQPDNVVLYPVSCMLVL